MCSRVPRGTVPLEETTKFMKKRLAIIAAAIAIACSVSSNASALTIVGIIEDGLPASGEVGYVNTLLGLTAPAGPVVIPAGTGETYTKYVDLGSGSIGTGTDSLAGTGTSVGSGWEYVAVKYDGQNGGIAVYYLNGSSATLPDSTGLWTNGGGQPFQVGSWTAYNTVETPSVPDGGSTVTLLGSALVAFGMVARKFRKS